MDEVVDGGRVLVVDDDVQTAEAVATALAVEGHVVDTASNGAVGIERVLTFRPDVVVFDFWMPVADGRELVLGIREVARTRVGLVAMSGTPEVEDWCGRVGISLFLRKPFGPAAVRAAVARALEEARVVSMRRLRISEPPPSRRARLDRAVLVVGASDGDGSGDGSTLRGLLRDGVRPMQVAVVPAVVDALRALDSITVDAVAICAAPLDDPRLAELVGASRARGLPIVLAHHLDGLDGQGCHIADENGPQGIARAVQAVVRGAE